MRKFNTLLKKFVELIIPNYVMTNQEKIITDLIDKIIQLPDTNKIMYSSRYMYFSNESKNIYILIENNYLMIMNNEKFFSTNCSGEFMNEITTITDKHFNSCIDAMKEKFVEKENTVLTEINNII